jgi:hypothetical protein
MPMTFWHVVVGTIGLTIIGFAWVMRVDGAYLLGRLLLTRLARW